MDHSRSEQALKAEAFDRLVERFFQLQDQSDFYSKNWVELGEFIEAERRRLRQALSR